MKRKVLALLMATTMLAGLTTGCGSKEAGTTEVKQETTAKEEASEAAPKEDSGEVVEIEYLNHKTETEAIEAMDQLIAKFEEENPDIKVTQTTNPDFATVIVTRAQTNEMPDLFSCSTNNTYEQMFSDGLIMDLSGQDFFQNINDDTVALSQYEGKNWRLPYSLSLYGLYVRTDILEENGCEIPETYDELKAVCEKLQANGVTPFLCADQDSGVVGQRMERLMGIIEDNDEEFKAIAAGSLDVKDSKVLNTYIDSQIFIANNTTADSMGVDQESSYQNFVNGDGAMLINGTWTLASLKSYNPDIKVALVPFPNPTGEETKVPMSIDTSFCISASTKHPEECLKFLTFLAEAENAQIYCDGEGSPNVIEGVTYGVSEFERIIDSMSKGKLFVSLNAIWPSGMRNDLRDDAGNLIMDKDPQAFLDAAAEKIPSYYNN